MPARRQLVIPILNRRRRRRIVTLKNFRNTLIAFLVVFVAVSIRSEMRRPRHGDYGRLYGKQIGKVEISAGPHVEIVPEAPAVADETSPYPRLFAPAAREQYLGSETTASVVPVESGFAAPKAIPGDHRGRIEIVGDADGVSIATDARRRERPLSGGIFK